MFPKYLIEYFTLAFLSIVKDSSDDIENRNHGAENSCHTEKPKNLAIFVA